VVAIDLTDDLSQEAWKHAHELQEPILLLRGVVIIGMDSHSTIMHAVLNRLACITRDLLLDQITYGGVCCLRHCLYCIAFECMMGLFS
jgi:hypothetical protein